MTFHLQSQFQAAFIWTSRPRSTSRSWLTSLLSRNRESPLSSISIDLLCLFSNQRCLPRKTARALKFSMKTQSYSILIRRSSPCWMYSLQRHLNKQEWWHLRKKSWGSWSNSRRSTRRSGMPNSLRHNVSRQQRPAGSRNLTGERSSRRLARRNAEQLTKSMSQEFLLSNT